MGSKARGKSKRKLGESMKQHIRKKIEPRRQTNKRLLTIWYIGGQLSCVGTGASCRPLGLVVRIAEPTNDLERTGEHVKDSAQHEIRYNIL